MLGNQIAGTKKTERTEVIYTIIKETGNGGPDPVSLTKVCSLLNVSRSGYYDWLIRTRNEPHRDLFEMKLKDEIQKIALEYLRYGYRRTTKELHRRGYPVNAKRVLKLMREDNLLCVKRIFRPMTTDSNHALKVYPNIAKDMVVTGLNQLWVADITYIRLLMEFIYLAVILDVFSRRCIGWELNRSLDTRLTLNALHRALETRKHEDLTGLVHHSDQGVQYTSWEYVDCLKTYGIRISMSRRGNVYDNAFAESFIKTLKYEEVNISEYRTFQDACTNLPRFIEQVYNEKRLHSAIGYMPPIEFEKEVGLNSVSQLPVRK